MATAVDTLSATDAYQAAKATLIADGEFKQNEEGRRQPPSSLRGRRPWTGIEAVLGVRAMGVDAIMVTLGDMKGQAGVTATVGQRQMAIGKRPSMGSSRRWPRTSSSLAGADQAMASHLAGGQFQAMASHLQFHGRRGPDRDGLAPRRSP